MYDFDPAGKKVLPPKVSGQKITRFVSERPAVFKGLKTNPTTIDRFLDVSEDSMRVRDEAVWVLGVYLSEIKKIPLPSRDPATTMFEASKAFFSMSEMKANQYLSSITGTYACYILRARPVSRMQGSYTLRR
jgi:hypothetical protein